MTSITVRDDAHWHELRSKHIGGSEVAALFGLSPFTTRWQLWMEKSGKLPPEDLSGKKHIQAGQFLERGIAEWASHIWKLPIHKVEDYYTVDDCPGMGASFDFATENMEPVEIKWSVFGDGWEYDAETITVAPENYILQVQQQMACSGAEFGWLIAMLRNEPRRMKIPRNDNIIASIKAEITAFWASVENGEAPDIDFSLDGDAVSRLLDEVPMSDVTLPDTYAAQFEAYLANAAAEKSAREEKERIKAMLLKAAIDEMEKMNTSQDKAIVRCGERQMSISTVKAGAGTLITPDMVGQSYGKRSAYKRITFK